MPSNANEFFFPRNESLLSRVTKSWSDLPWWKKALGHLTVTAPSLALNIMLDDGYALFLTSLIITASTAWLLEDHARWERKTEEMLTLHDILVLHLIQKEIAEENSSTMEPCPR